MLLGKYIRESENWQKRVDLPKAWTKAKTVKVETPTHRHRYKERKTEQENTRVANMFWELCSLAPLPSDTLQKMSVLGLADKGNGVQSRQEASTVPVTCM